MDHMPSLVVLRGKTDGTFGLLNIVEIPDGGREHQEKIARKLAQGWQGIFPGEQIVVRSDNRADKCKPVNNHDGFVTGN